MMMREAIMMMREAIRISNGDHLRRSVQKRRNQSPSSAIRSVLTGVIKRNQRRNQSPSSAIRSVLTDVIKRNQANQAQSGAIRRVLTGGMSVACAASHSKTSRVPSAGSGMQAARKSPQAPGRRWPRTRLADLTRRAAPT